MSDGQRTTKKKVNVDWFSHLLTLVLRQKSNDSEVKDEAREETFESHLSLERIKKEV